MQAKDRELEEETELKPEKGGGGGVDRVPA